jgi:hypothetical protein
MIVVDFGRNPTLGRWLVTRPGALPHAPLSLAFGQWTGTDEPLVKPCRITANDRFPAVTRKR